MCKDRQPNNGLCAKPRNSPPAGGTNRMEAYSNPLADWSRITFCNRFFQLNSLGDAITFGKKKSWAQRMNLETYNSRARCFLHEATHLDFFMNTPEKGPFIEDVKFVRKEGSNKITTEAYGPSNCKILRNHGKNPGFYPQQNGKTTLAMAIQPVTCQIVLC